LIRAIFGPSIVPFIDVGVMEFIAFGFELIPLNPGMQDIHFPFAVQKVQKLNFQGGPELWADLYFKPRTSSCYALCQAAPA
jgi:hypothetical protein